MNTTPLVVLTLFIILGLYDFGVVYFGKGVESSVSRCLQRAGFKSPMFVLMLGMVMGHLFFAMKPECDCPVPVDKIQEKS